MKMSLQSLNFQNWKVTNRERCNSSFCLPMATQLCCKKEIPELEGILSGVGLPQGHVCFNAAALRPGSKAEQR